MLHAYYDCIVVGAGISGLYITRELLKAYPTMKIALAEKYKGLGGRTYSYKPSEGILWEMGAGRIHNSHTILLHLVKEYGLHTIPISSKSSYLSKEGGTLVDNPFESFVLPFYIEPLCSLSSKLLATHTIQELLLKLYGPSTTKSILDPFPYRAEVTTLRADLGLQSFFKGEMGALSGYSILKEGFSELIARLRKDVEERGCTILPRHELINLKQGPEDSTDLTFKYGYNDGTITLRALQHVVLALHKDAVSKLKPFYKWPVLKYLKTEPLLRTYMIFDTSKGPVWFSDLNKVVTPCRPRYIIPIDAKKGVIMISYTDANDARHYMKYKDPNVLQKVILQDIRALFPDRTIPDPVFFKAHQWDTGATYWLPGSYNPEDESLYSVKPLPSVLPNVWLCGESWSMRQAWVEGALEQTQLCLSKMKKTNHR